ncbi:MAG: hypothetical protein L3J97_00090, partial [Thermoplasmata archaeon]|nr:hypothetical protein [Thermoplasmata archaeon]
MSLVTGNYYALGAWNGAGTAAPKFFYWSSDVASWFYGSLGTANGTISISAGGTLTMISKDPSLGDIYSGYYDYQTASVTSAGGDIVVPSASSNSMPGSIQFVEIYVAIGDHYGTSQPIWVGLTACVSGCTSVLIFCQQAYGLFYSTNYSDFTGPMGTHCTMSISAGNVLSVSISANRATGKTSWTIDNLNNSQSWSSSVTWTPSDNIVVWGTASYYTSPPFSDSAIPTLTAGGFSNPSINGVSSKFFGQFYVAD